jgi:hypothetical protein
LAEDEILWWVLANTVINLLLPERGGPLYHIVKYAASYK